MAMATTGGIQLIDAFRYSGQRFLDLRQHCATLADLTATPETSIPNGFNKFVDSENCWYEYNSHNTIDPETGKWRKSVPIYETISEEYIFAITDAEGTFLFGIRDNGEVVYNRGMSDEVRARLTELDGIRQKSDENFVFSITDLDGCLLFGITGEGEVVYNKGMSDEVREILHDLNKLLSDTRERMDKAEKAITEIKERLAELDGIQIIENENFIFAITATGIDIEEEYILFGIRHNGEVVYDKGIPGDVQKRFDELEGYRIIQDENYLFSITDNVGTLLFGIEKSGHIVMPQGQVQMLTRDQYAGIEPKRDTLYIIKGRNGTTEGAYINGQTLNAGEAYNFFRDENTIKYRGGMTSKPLIHIDHETMEAKIDYPSDYEGPMIVSDPETKTLFVI